MPFMKYPKLTLPRKWLPKACKPLGNERKITYIADFVYQAEGFRIVEDVKGKRTKEYVLKPISLSQKRTHIIKGVGSFLFSKNINNV